MHDEDHDPYIQVERLEEALTTAQAEIEALKAEVDRLSDFIGDCGKIEAALRARVAELEAENVKLKGFNRTHVKSAFFEGFDAARQIVRSDAWEESATRRRIDYPDATLGAKP